MDEPTASLDPVTESEIYEQFEEFTKGKTAILVTHRLSAAKLCDVICYFEKGRIIEIGSHALHVPSSYLLYAQVDKIPEVERIQCILRERSKRNIWYICYKRWRQEWISYR